MTDYMNLCTFNVSKQLWKIWSEWFLDESKEFGKVGCQCLVKHRSISRRQYFTLQSEWADSVCCQVWEPIRETNSRSNHQGTLDQSSQLAERGLKGGKLVDANDLHLKKGSAGENRFVEPSPEVLACDEKASTTTTTISTTPNLVPR